MPVSYPDSRIRSTLDLMQPIFMEQFGAQEGEVEWLLFTFAPGRVNFYGEHVDYMGGRVTPAAVREGCHILVGRVAKHTADHKLRFATTEKQSFELDSTTEGDHNKNWTTFVRGATCITLDHLKAKLGDPAFRGVCVLSHGTLPMGAGMSASASFDVALLNALFTVGTSAYKKYPYRPNSKTYPELPKGSRDELISLTKLAQSIETTYCGVNVGIMDQFASVHATHGAFMALDCSSLLFENCQVGNITGDDGCFLLVNSMVKHELTADDNGSSYNAIRSDAEGAEKVISQVKLNGQPFRFCDLANDPKRFTNEDPIEFVKSCKSSMTQTQYDRGLYNIEEQLRTKEYISLTSPDCPLTATERYKRAGELLNANHAGLRDLVRISTPELNFIHDTINTDPGVSGGRLMGGGFGGCVILLLKKDAVNRVMHTVQESFQAKFGMKPAIYPVELCDGAFIASLWEGERAKL